MKSQFFALILLSSCPLLIHASADSSSSSASTASTVAGALKNAAEGAIKTEMVNLEQAAESALTGGSASATTSSSMASMSSSSASSSSSVSSNSSGTLSTLNNVVAGAAIAAQNAAANAAGAGALVNNPLATAAEQKEKALIAAGLGAGEAKLAAAFDSYVEPKLQAGLAIAHQRIDALAAANFTVCGCCPIKISGIPAAPVACAAPTAAPATAQMQ